MVGPSRAISADILLSHTHWDHIQGLPFFKPLSGPGNSFCIYGAEQEGVALEEILRRQMDPMVFPVPLRALAAAIRVTEIAEGHVELADFVVRAFRLRHPGTTLGYRLAPAAGGRDIAYLTDNELGDGAGYPVSPNWRARLVEFLSGTDTLIHDAMYSEQIINARCGWGHSTPRQAVALAARGRMPETHPVSSRAGARRRRARPPARGHPGLRRPNRGRAGGRGGRGRHGGDAVRSDDPDGLDRGDAAGGIRCCSPCRGSGGRRPVRGAAVREHGLLRPGQGDVHRARARAFRRC